MSVTGLREQRCFFQYLAGNSVTLTCVWMQRIAILWIAWELTQSFMWSGVISLLQLLPTILLGPVFGVHADRWPTAPAMIGVQLVFVALSLCIYALQIGEFMTIELLAFFAFSIGVTTAAHHPLRMALTPRLVTKPFLPKGIALDSMNFNVTRMLGPAIGGAVIAAWGVSAALLAGVLGYLPLIAALMFLPRSVSSRMRETKTSFREDAALAIDVIRADSRIVKSLLITAVFGFFARGFVELFPPIADGSFAQGASGAGYLMSAAGIGALFGAIILMTNVFPGAGQRQKLADASAIVSLICLASMIVPGQWHYALVAAGVMGFAGAVVGIVNQTAIQSNIPIEFQGRVMSIWTMLTVGSTALGALAYGAVSDLFSVVAASLVGALLGGVLMTYISVRGRKFDDSAAPLRRHPKSAKQ